MKSRSFHEKKLISCRKLCQIKKGNSLSLPDVKNLVQIVSIDTFKPRKGKKHIFNLSRDDSWKFYVGFFFLTSGKTKIKVEMGESLGGGRFYALGCSKSAEKLSWKPWKNLCKAMKELTGEYQLLQSSELIAKIVLYTFRTSHECIAWNKVPRRGQRHEPKMQAEAWAI